MGILRDVRRSGRPLAAAGQLSGASGRRRRAPHLAHEHGTCSAGESVGLRLRLHTGRTTPPAHGECDGHHDGTGTARGTFLQLVRHAVPEAAPAALCLGGGQREPRGPSDDLAAGPRRTCRRQDHEPAMVRRIERHAAHAHRCRWRNRGGAARSPAEGSGDRLRLPAHDDRSGTAVAGPARRRGRRGHRTVRGHCRRRLGQRTCAVG